MAGDMENFEAGGPAALPEVSTAKLPTTAAVIFGRDEELAWLDACWRDGVRVASVVAMGGAGKSALVNAWLRRMGKDGWRGARRVLGWSFYSQGTDRLSSSDEFVASALKWFGYMETTAESPWDKGERLARLVRQEKTLLVLDGLEPLQWGPGAEPGKVKDPAIAALVRELAVQNPGLCVITSRIGLADLEPYLGYGAEERKLYRLSPEAGAELLIKLGATGLADELRKAAEEYDGHCLALTLLGNYVRRAQLGDIRKRDHIPPLEGKPAQRMMARYEQWFEKKPELAILRMLGLFDRPAAEDEIRALRAAPTIVGFTDMLDGMPESSWHEAVTTLRDVGLLADDAEREDKLDAHPLVREYFGAQLRRGWPETWRQGHGRLYEHLRKKAEQLPDTIEGMAPLYAAVVHGCLAGNSQEALLEVWCKRIQRNEEAFNAHKLGAVASEIAILSAFFDPPWERLAPGLDEPSQGYILNEAGLDLHALGRLSEATGVLRMGLARILVQKDPKNAASGASNLSDILRTRGELSEALVSARHSVEFADESGDALRRMSTRATEAATLHALGRRDEAKALFEESERIQKEWQSDRPLLYSLRGFQYCDLLLDQGRKADVLIRASQALKIAEHNHQLFSIALDHVSIACAYLPGTQRDTGTDLDKTADHLKEAVDGLRRAGTQHYLPLGLLARAALHLHTGDLDDARRDLTEALTLATRCGFRLHECDAHLGHTHLALATNDPTAARKHLARASKIIAETGYHRRDAELADLEAQVSAMPQPPPPARPLDPVIDDLRAAYDRGDLIVFAGPGISTAAGLPGPKQLAEQLLARVRSPDACSPLAREMAALLDHNQITDALSGAKLALGPAEFGHAVERALSDTDRDIPAVARAIAALKPKLRAVLTTNLDHIIERAFEGTWHLLPATVGDLAQRRGYILKLDGTLLDRDTWVMTRDQVDRAMFASPRLDALFGALYRARPMLFIGLDAGDFERILAQARALASEQAPAHYALLPGPVAPSFRRRLEGAGLRLVTYTDSDGSLAEAAAILASLAGAAPPPSEAARPQRLGVDPEAQASAIPEPPPPPPARPIPLPTRPSPVRASAVAEGPDSMTEKFDIAIVCALPTPELAEVLHTGKQTWSDLPFTDDDPGTYHETVYTTAWGQRLRVVAAAPTQMGMAASAVVATKMIRRFHPDLVAMVGIAAGVDRTKQGFGDILAPNCTFDYGSGKIKDGGKELRFIPDPKPLDIESILAGRLDAWKRDEPHLGDIRKRWRDKRPDTALKLHVGPLGSGAAVVAAQAPVEQVRDHFRKLIGIEMEAYGVHLACKHAARDAPMFLCMKSICDFADAQKDDDWQHYAAYTAAQLFHELVAEEWETLFPPPDYPLRNVVNWDLGLSAEGRMQGALRVRIHNASSGKKDAWGGIFLQQDPGFDATSYRRLGIELRVNKGIDHRVEIKLETPDGKKQHQVFLAPLSKFGREGEWLKVGVDIDRCDRRILEQVGRVELQTASADLPRGQEIEIDVRRVVFLR
jgi:nucleoside phosphorylase/tetratricopeptide (TPR) repeat protein